MSTHIITVPHPHPVRIHAFDSQRQQVEMAYLDVAPTGKANGRTALLLHGKNFCAATWEQAIAALAGAGYRVIAPDQVGFCKSSKPDGYQYALAGLAHNTRGLLEALGIERTVVVGHSMGGMLAMRYALMYPEAVEHLALVGPIGLEDWKAMGVPYQPVEQVYASELRTSYDSIRDYQLAVYYAGEWRPEFERWARMQAGMYAGPGREVVAWHQTLTFDMLMGQPVVYELPALRVPTTLFIGVHDRRTRFQERCWSSTRILDIRRISRIRSDSTGTCFGSFRARTFAGTSDRCQGRAQNLQVART